MITKSTVASCTHPFYWLVCGLVLAFFSVCVGVVWVVGFAWLLWNAIKLRLRNPIKLLISVCVCPSVCMCVYVCVGVGDICGSYTVASKIST